MRTVAAAYHRGRPAYPLEAVRWLAGEQPQQVLELGAGTGKLTQVLVDLGHQVHATEPDEAMLDALRAAHPLVRASRTGAEELPFDDQSYDVVVAGQAFDRFDLERTLPEISRVLRPGGHLAVVWNMPDTRVPWVRRLDALLGDEERTEAETLEKAGLFGWVEDAAFKHRFPIDRETVRDLALSRPHIAALPEADRDAKVAQVRAFYDDYGRGMDGMVLPLIAHCLRARVAEKAQTKVQTKAACEPDSERGEDMLVTTGSIPRIEVDVATAPPSVLDDDTAMLLIDFR